MPVFLTTFFIQLCLFGRTMCSQAVGCCFSWHNRREELRPCVMLFLLKTRICQVFNDVPFTNVDFSVEYAKPVHVLSLWLRQNQC